MIYGSPIGKPVISHQQMWDTHIKSLYQIASTLPQNVIKTFFSHNVCTHQCEGCQSGDNVLMVIYELSDTDFPVVVHI